ncbi:hypothetical protein [Corynebacterium accolens]|uniref:hypothetical protein n=1 Tax=Corynebacterium accolens TaxID=38284 RepID=UPI001EDC69C1|nr:hypothetical protein [Corynebacterium accolens]MDK4209440.1 hypothetical protein [Corynebacterium accolens]MDK4233680.1 hypothetical protein [Corynebacterium accolens]WKS65907.1 hypothetical protein NLL33_06425 [Corynebacterium accolens]
MVIAVIVACVFIAAQYELNAWRIQQERYGWGIEHSHRRVAMHKHGMDARDLEVLLQ